MAWILVATDGSEGSETAIRLVASIAWPSNTTIGVVTVVPPATELIGMPYVPVVPSNTAEIEQTVLRRAEEITWGAVDRLRASGRSAHCRVSRGRPADVLVSLAARYGADLVVMGSRGLGTFQSAILGSVSAEVIDRAPCPVLIARSDQLGPTLIADDGSPQAEAARAYVAQRPYLVGSSVSVVGVVPTQQLWPDALVPLDGRSMELLVESRAAQRSALQVRLTADAADMAAAGLVASVQVREGNPAQELIEAATEARAGLIVAGSHGRRGLQRLARGSVSRALSHGAPGSVLIVPPPRGGGQTLPAADKAA